MDRIFYRKTTSILFVTAILVLLILVCMLLVSLTQLASLNAQADALHERILQATDDIEAKNQLLQDRDSLEYVIKWAEKNGRISEDDVKWINDNLK